MHAWRKWPRDWVLSIWFEGPWFESWQDLLLAGSPPPGEGLSFVPFDLRVISDTNLSSEAVLNLFQFAL